MKNSQWKKTIDDPSHDTGGDIMHNLVRWERGQERYEAIELAQGSYGVEYYADEDAEPETLGMHPTKDAAVAFVEKRILED